MQSSISVELRRSRLLDSLLIAVHATAVACTAMTHVPPVLAFPLFGLVVLSGWKSLSRPTISRLQLSKAGALLYRSADGELPIKARILPETTVFRFLIVLSLRAEEGDASVIRITLLPDQMRPAEFRQIRVWLRWQVRNDAKELV